MATETTTVMVGTTGAGKSATGNTLVNPRRPCWQGPFPSNQVRQLISQTRVAQAEQFQYQGEPQLLVDTVGQSDTQLTPEQMLQFFDTLVHYAPTINVVLYFVGGGRFLPQHDMDMRAFVHLFGVDILQRTILVFTGIDDNSLQTQLQQHAGQNQQNRFLQPWLNSLGGRLLGIDNRDHDPARKEADRNRILDSIDVLAGQQTEPFSHTAFIDARNWREGALERAQRLNPVHRVTAELNIQQVATGHITRDEALNNIVQFEREEAELAEEGRRRKEAEEEARKNKFAVAALHLLYGNPMPLAVQIGDEAGQALNFGSTGLSPDPRNPMGFTM